MPTGRAVKQKAFEVSDGNPLYLARVGYTFGLEGKRSEAKKVVSRLTDLSKRRYVSSFDVALVYVGLGEKDAAFEWLEKALAERSSDLVFLNWNDKLASLRSDARFSQLLRQVGLPE